MHAYNTQLLTPRSALGDSFRRLAQVKPGAAPFLSAYLDLDPGLGPAGQRLDEWAQALRVALRGPARQVFDTTLGLVQDVLHGPINPAARGLAVFARSLGSGRFLSTLQVDTPVPDRLVSYRVPDLAPLLRIDHEAQQQVLLLARRGTLQIFDLVAGTATPRAWTALTHIDSCTFLNASADRSAVAPDPSAASGRRRHVAQRLLATGVRSPVVVAGDQSTLGDVVDGLPSQFVARLSGVIAVPAGLGQSEALRFVTQRLNADRCAMGKYLMSQLLRGVLDGGTAVVGSLAALEALRAGRAAKLFIAAQRETSPAWSCEHCAAVAASVAPRECCARCGEPGVDPWLAETELVRLASQQGLPVVYIDAKELRRLGGVACLLAKTPAPESMGEPRAPRWLDLVA